MKYNTLHMFGYGECQVITDTENKKVPSDELSDVQPVVYNVYSLKPADIDAGVDYRVITIIKDLFVDYSDNEGRRFRVEYSELDTALIDALVEEVLNY